MGPNAILILIGVLVVAVVLYRIFGKKTKEEIELKERLEDETIQVGGRKVTLEQAENETFVWNDEIDSVEEIEASYSEAERDMEYIRRDLDLLDNWIHPGEPDELIKRAQQLNEYTDVHITLLSQYKPDFLIGIISLTYTYRVRHERTETDEQILIILNNRSDNDRFKVIKGVVIEQLENNIIIRQPKIATHKEFRRLVMEVEKLV